MSSPLYDVFLKRSDPYDVVISKISETISIKKSDEMRLFNGKGAIISNQPVTLRNKKVEWTLGSFISRRHTSPDKVMLGVGSILENELASKY